MHAEELVYSLPAVHFQMRRSGMCGRSWTPSILSQSWTYSIKTAAVGVPMMSLAHYRLASASFTEWLRLRLPTARNKFGAKQQMVPFDSQASIQKRAVAPSPT